MHYLALILIPIGVIIWGYQYRKRASFKIKGTILAIFTFLIIMLPLFIFDLKHDFLNYKAMVNLNKLTKATSLLRRELDKHKILK